MEDSAHKIYVSIVGLGEDPRVSDKQFFVDYISSRAFAEGGATRNADGFLPGA